VEIIKKSSIHGFGLFTNEFIKKGDKIYDNICIKLSRKYIEKLDKSIDNKLIIKQILNLGWYGA
jgi:SET domain-containing protein